MHHPTDRITHTTTFVTPVVEHWLEREIAQWVVKPMQNKKNSMEISLSSKGQNKSKILLSKISILHRLVLLNSVLFKPCLFRFTLER